MNIGQNLILDCHKLSRGSNEKSYKILYEYYQRNIDRFINQFVDNGK